MRGSVTQFPNPPLDGAGVTCSKSKNPTTGFVVSRANSFLCDWQQTFQNFGKIFHLKINKNNSKLRRGNVASLQKAEKIEAFEARRMAECVTLLIS